MRLFPVLFGLLALAAVPARAEPALSPAPWPPAGKSFTCDPYYPAALKNAGIAGRTILAVHIATDGSLSQARVAQSSGSADLDAAAIACTSTGLTARPVQDGAPIEVDWLIKVQWSSIRSSYILPAPLMGGTCVGFFPPAASRAGVQGRTSISFHIAKDGSVQGIAVTQSSGSVDLDQATIACVSTWRYPVATHDGEPVQLDRKLIQSWITH